MDGQSSKPAVQGRMGSIPGGGLYIVDEFFSAWLFTHV